MAPTHEKSLLRRKFILKIALCYLFVKILKRICKNERFYYIRINVILKICYSKHNTRSCKLL